MAAAVAVPGLQRRVTLSSGPKPAAWASLGSRTQSEFWGAGMACSWSPALHRTGQQAARISLRMPPASASAGAGVGWRQPGSPAAWGESSKLEAVPLGLGGLGLPKPAPRKCQAASSEGAGELQKTEDTGKLSAVQLTTYFGMWYLYNVIFNIYNKKALNVFPFPWFQATFQLLAGAVWMAGLWGTRLQPCPPVTKEFIKALLVPAFFHTVGHIAACFSFSKVAVSFTHIIKSAEPVFSVAFSSVLGESYPLLVWLSLIPIMFGCGLAAATELSFNLAGFWGAMISNFAFVLRNIYSKRSLKNFKQYDGINCYGWITIISTLYLAPFAVLFEGGQWVSGYKQAVTTLGDQNTLLLWIGASGIFYHLYNQASYQALGGISPLTFSVGNTMKRVVVIVATVIAFRNPIRPLNALGSAIAILGTFLYSQASARSKKIKAP